ncbi:MULTISPECIES: hypothetical protein [unclassified Microcoleus]
MGSGQLAVGSGQLTVDGCH